MRGLLLLMMIGAIMILSPALAAAQGGLMFMPYREFTTLTTTPEVVPVGYVVPTGCACGCNQTTLTPIPATAVVTVPTPLVRAHRPIFRPWLWGHGIRVPYRRY
jgi:hypothetical protein